jgi:hypothetical protein
MTLPEIIIFQPVLLCLIVAWWRYPKSLPGKRFRAKSPGNRAVGRHAKRLNVIYAAANELQQPVRILVHARPVPAPIRQYGRLGRTCANRRRLRLFPNVCRRVRAIVRSPGHRSGRIFRGDN